MPARKLPKDYHKLAESKGIKWLGPEVSNTHVETWWECERDHRWEAWYNDVRQWKKCPVCAAEKIATKKCARCGGALPEGSHWNRKYCSDKCRFVNYCFDCNKEISPRAKRCYSCAKKLHWVRGDYTEEWRQKNSEARKADWARGIYDSEEIRQKISVGIKNAHARGCFKDIHTEEVRRKQSEGSRTARAQGIYDNIFTEKVRQKMSKAMKAAWENGVYDNIPKAISAAWKKGNYDNIHTEEWRRKSSEAMKASWARGDFDGVFQSPTSIEIAVSNALDQLGIRHVSQWRPDGCSYIYDEFIAPNIFIEVQGDYWHGPNKPRRQKRDVEKAQWAKKRGFQLVIIWEHEIKEIGALQLVKERILSLKPIVGNVDFYEHQQLELWQGIE